MTQPIIYEIMENSIAILRVNQPQACSALNWQAQTAFATAVSHTASHQERRVLIIT